VGRGDTRGADPAMALKIIWSPTRWTTAVA